MDVEFIVQVLQIRHASDAPHLRSTRTLEGLDRLAEGGALLPEDAAHLQAREVELWLSAKRGGRTMKF